MTTRKLLAILLVVGLLVPAAGVAASAQSDSPTATTGGGTASGQESAHATAAANFTRLYISDRYKSLRLKPGESETVTVTVENGEDESVDLSPHVFVPPRGQRPIDADWVSLGTDDVTLDAGETREFDITVSVPEDTPMNQYGGMIAFTDETVTYPGRPARPVHAASLSVEVWQEPTVRILSERHAYTQVQAGESFTHEIVVKNTGDQAVPVNPEMVTENRRVRPYQDRETLDRSWVEIDAPNEVEPGETATVEVTVSPPTDAERGDYTAELNLGLKAPHRRNDNAYWQRVDLRFQVWSQPEHPFETSFEVSDDTETVTLELSSNRYPRADDNLDPASFDVTFVSPTGRQVDAERAQVTNRGGVDLGERRRPARSGDSTYATSGGQKTFTYRLEEPEAGSWSVRIMPHNTMRFQYEVVRDEGN